MILYLRGHAAPDFLRKLNAGKDLDKLKPGDTVRVPNVEPFKIEDVKEIGELRHLFNADEGTPRLILLLSPT